MIKIFCIKKFKYKTEDEEKLEELEKIVDKEGYKAKANSALSELRKIVEDGRLNEINNIHISSEKAFAIFYSLLSNHLIVISRQLNNLIKSLKNGNQSS